MTIVVFDYVVSNINIYLPSVWNPILHKICWHVCFLRLHAALGGNLLVLPFILVFPTGKTFIFRSLPVSPVFHFGEGVRAAIWDHPAVFGPQGLCLGCLAGGGPLQAHRDSLGRTGHQGDGLSVQSRTCGRDIWELKDLVLVWRREHRLWRKELVYGTFRPCVQYICSNVIRPLLIMVIDALFRKCSWKSPLQAGSVGLLGRELWVSLEGETLPMELERISFLQARTSSSRHCLWQLTPQSVK